MRCASESFCLRFPPHNDIQIFFNYSNIFCPVYSAHNEEYIAMSYEIELAASCSCISNDSSRLIATISVDTDMTDGVTELCRPAKFRHLMTPSAIRDGNTHNSRVSYTPTTPYALRLPLVVGSAQLSRNSIVHRPLWIRHAHVNCSPYETICNTEQ